EIPTALMNAVEGGQRPSSLGTELEVSEQVFTGGGQTGLLLHQVDWRNTPLGSVFSWPQIQKAVVSTALANPLPTSVVWGAEMIQLYNDAYAGLLGDGHPAALGRPLREAPPASWELLGPHLERVRATGRPALLEDYPLSILSQGQPG